MAEGRHSEPLALFSILECPNFHWNVESSKMIITVENQPWYPRWRQAVQRLILARETLRDTEEGTPARMEAEIEYQAALSAYKLIADQV